MSITNAHTLAFLAGFASNIIELDKIGQAKHIICDLSYAVYGELILSGTVFDSVTSYKKHVTVSLWLKNK